MNIIRAIIGEAAEEQDEPKKKKSPEPKEPKGEEPKAKEKSKAPAAAPSETEGNAPAEAEIDELAAMWNSGNKDEVVQRFMGMDNFTAVKVVFAIGREGALELGRMTDEALERQSDQEGVEPAPDAGEGAPGEESTEPMEVQPSGQQKQEPDAFGRKPGQGFDINWAKHIMGYDALNH